MADGESNPFLITPPPGLVPTPAAAPAPEPTAVTPPRDLIGLPPGVADSGTHRLSPSARAAAAPAAATPVAAPIAFRPAPAFPTPGVAPVAPAAPAVTPVPRVDAAPAPAVTAPETAPTPIAASMPTAAPASVAATPDIPVLVMADGTRHPLGSTVLIGRNPAAVGDWASADLLAVVDPLKSVSKTHAALQVDAGTIRVFDLNSTNGVVVVRAGRGTTVVEPGLPVETHVGDRVRLGDFEISIT